MCLGLCIGSVFHCLPPLPLQHGHAKANITGVDIFTGNKYMDVSPTSHTMSAPVGECLDDQVLAGGRLSHALCAPSSALTSHPH